MQGTGTCSNRPKSSLKFVKIIADKLSEETVAIGPRVPSVEPQLEIAQSEQGRVPCFN